MATLATTQKLKTPLSALQAASSFGGTVRPPGPAGTTMSASQGADPAAPATPSAYDPVAASANWFARAPVTPAAPAGAPTMTSQAEWDLAKAGKTPFNQAFASGNLLGPASLGARPIDPSAVQREAEQKYQTETGDLQYRRAQADAANAAEEARVRESALRAGGMLPGVAGGGALAGGAGGGLSLNQIKALMAELGLGETTGSAPAATIPAPTAPATVAAGETPARIAPQAAPDTRAAEAATWARSKDVIGRQTAGALTSLREAQAARGFGRESGVYAAEEGDVMSEGLRSLGDVARKQAEDALAAERARATQAYEGGITQRGQDIGVLGAKFTGDIGQRGQDIGLAATGYTGAITQAGQAQQEKLAKLGLLPSFLALLKNAAY